MKPTIFLDRDGVINTNGFVNTVEDFQFIEGALEAIAHLYRAGYYIFVVTNQGGVEAGYLTEEQLADIHNFMLSEIHRVGGDIDRVYHCPHLSKSACACRKPRTGMLQQAKADYPNVSFTNAYFVGDYITDWQCGVALGIQPVAVRTGRYADPEVQAYVEKYRIPIFDDLLHFANFLYPRTRR